ncbi:MAG: T-complex protein 1 theta subunit [Piptocephalis tieghemiana]|nr:MAG: T-complex protein 1 theta subunit [Piptocephalis tieghemiana]
MALRVPQPSTPQLFKNGYTYLQGVDEAVLRNISATRGLADMTRTSFGPNGRNKMIVNHLEKLFVTNDAATIIRELEVAHPAARMMVQASQQQEQEVGDGTNLVVILAGELLKQAEDLLRLGLHPSEVVTGYELASHKALELISELSTQSEVVRDPRDASELRKAVYAAISSKQPSYSSFLTDLVLNAALAVMPRATEDFNVDSVRVVKVLGASLSDSRMVPGMVFGREPEGMVRRVSDAKVAIFTCPLDVALTETKGTVLLKNADELMGFSRGEEEMVEAQVKALADAGVKVVVGGSGMGELMLHYLNRYHILVIKILSKFEIRRLCRVVGATALARFGVPMAEEMGYCAFVETTEIGGDRVTVFRQEEDSQGLQTSADGKKRRRTRTATIVLRGATANHLDDVERAIDDGINVIKAVARDGRLLPGAGATEMEISRLLGAHGDRVAGLHQHAIKRFARALEIVPRTLAETSGLDPTQTISALQAAHHTGSQITTGVDVKSDGIGSNGLIDARELGLWDVAAVKESAIRLATEASLTILRVDQIIMSKPAGGPKPPSQMGARDD